MWQRAKSGQYKSHRKCPICQNDLPEVPIVNEDKTINLDICTKCWFIWFDGHEYESLPKQKASKPEKELSPDARKALAMFKVQVEEGSLGDENVNLILDVGEAVLYLLFRMFIK